MNFRWRGLRALCAGGTISVGILCLNQVRGSSETQRYVEGELIVSFVEQARPAMVESDGKITSAFAELNSVLDGFQLSGSRPLFYPNSPLQNVFVFEFPVNTDLDALSGLIQDMPFIKRAEKNVLMEVDLDYIPRDYACRHDWFCNGSGGRTDTWPFWSMQLDRAWDIVRGDASVVIAIMDSGLDYRHPSLSLNVWQNLGEDFDQDGHTLEKVGMYYELDPGDLNGVDDDDGGDGPVDDLIGWDFIDRDRDPFEELDIDFSHGTAMGSIVSSRTDDSEVGGTAGISWQSKLMALRSVWAENDDYVESAWVIGATNFAAAKGADIVNMSFSTDVDASIWHDAIIAADNAGVIFLSSAGVRPRGGFGSDLALIEKRYPQWWEEVICVAAVDTFGFKKEGETERVRSNWGTTVDISGYSNRWNDPPGSGHVVCIYDAGPGPFCSGDTSQHYPGSIAPHYFYYSGMVTSGACAEASGVLALLKSMYPTASSEFLKQELYRGATPLPDALWDPDIEQSKLGHGAINAYRSLTQWGTISQNTTWANTVYVSGDVTIAPGKTLTINPGTIVNIAEDDNEHTGSQTTRIEFNVEGFLDVNGTEANPVVFRSWTGQSTLDWAGFYIDNQSTGASFDHCIIKNAEVGIETWKSVTVTNSTIDSCQSGLASYGGNLVVTNSAVRNCGFGVFVSAASPNVATVIGTTVEDCDYGVWSYSGGVVDIRDSEFRDNEEGIHAVSGGTAIAVNDGCVFKHNNYGITCNGASPEIYNSTIDSSSTDGIFCNGSSGPMVEGNDVRYNYAAVYCYGSSDPVVQWNTVTHNVKGVEAAAYSDPDLGLGLTSEGNNQFQYNSAVHVANLTEELTVIAENNFWGNTVNPCFPKTGKILGSVDFAPALCEPPLVAMAELGGDRNEHGIEAVPRVFALGPCVPNPFNPSTTVHYEVPRPGGPVDLRIYNVAGQLVRVLVDEFEGPGYHQAVWDGSDSHGTPVASAVYFVRMRTGSFTDVRKIVLLK